MNELQKITVIFEKFGPFYPKKHILFYKIGADRAENEQKQKR